VHCIKDGAWVRIGRRDIDRAATVLRQVGMGEITEEDCPGKLVNGMMIVVQGDDDPDDFRMRFVLLIEAELRKDLGGYARNRGPGVNRQIVGWRVRVQASDDFVTWSTVRETSVTTTSATDVVEAGYQPRTVAVPTDKAVRVRVVMLWYKPGSRTRVAGRAIHEVDHYYRYSDGTLEDLTVGGCPADLPG
jgi:hypothetical protein